MSSTASLIQSLASSYGVPPSLALAVAIKESGPNLNQGAIGSSGEIGVFQLMPATAKQLGVDPSDLTQNIDGGLSYLQSLYNQFGNWTDALEAYNGGASHVISGTVSLPAQSYATSVLASAGISDGSDGSTTSDSTQASPTTDLFASVDSLDLSSLTDPSQPMFWAALGLGALVVAWVVTR